MQPVLTGAQDGSGVIQNLSVDTNASDNRGFGARNAQLGTAIPYSFNEAGFDRVRGNTINQIIASAARTAGLATGTLVNYNARGVKAVIDVTAASGTGGLTVQIQAVDALSGKFVTLLQSAVIIAVSTVTLTIYPGLAALANVSANDILPRAFRVNITAGDGSSYTYTVALQLVV